uniref:Uncharacterized protein n=1 Tax=Aegilops tauschii subsp. strangulata TaxID=200361 RepID=A0A453N648_AEGTS
ETRVYTLLRSELKERSTLLRCGPRWSRGGDTLLSYGLHSPSPLFLSPGHAQAEFVR